MELQGHRIRVEIQTGSVVWSLQIFAGSVLATISLWAVADMQTGIPYLTVGRPLNFLRNFSALLALSFVWFAWAGMIWYCFRQEEGKRDIAGLLYVCPLSLFFGAFAEPESVGLWIRTFADSLLPNAYYGAAIARYGLLGGWLMVPGLLVGFILGNTIKYCPRLLSLGVGGILVATLTHTQEIAFQPQHLLQAGGLLVPIVCLFLWIRNRIQAAPLCFILIGVCFLAQPVWLCIVVTVSVISWAQVVSGDEVWGGVRVRTALVVVCLVSSMFILRMNAPIPLPNHHYRNVAAGFFLTHHQPYEKYRIIVREIRPEEML